MELRGTCAACKEHVECYLTPPGSSANSAAGQLLLAGMAGSLQPLARADSAPGYSSTLFLSLFFIQSRAEVLSHSVVHGAEVKHSAGEHSSGLASPWFWLDNRELLSCCFSVQA